MKRRILSAGAGLFALTMITAGAMPALDAHLSCGAGSGASSCTMAHAAQPVVDSSQS